MSVGDSGGSPMVKVGYSSCVPVPAVGAPLTNPTKSIIITTAGNLGVVFPDGTNNNAQLFAVTVGQQFDLSIVSMSAASTAAALGLR